MALESDPAVEDLDHVDLAHLGEVAQRALPDVRLAERVERVRDADESTLPMNLVRGLVRAEAARDRLREEEADDLAVRGRDLLAENDGQPVGQAQLGDLVAHRDRALDVVVVRDRDVREPALDGLLDEPLLGEQRVTAEPRVDVEVGEGLFRGWLSGGRSLVDQARAELGRRGGDRHIGGLMRG